MTLNADAEPGQQGGIDWLMSRVGYVTCSRFEDVMAVLKNGSPAKAREDYLLEVVAERLTGKPIEHYVNAAMEWGQQFEAEARMAYESHTGSMVIEQGFLHHPTIDMCGGSVDGLVDDDGIIEIKAPNTTTHLRTIASGECKHLPQIQGYLFVTGRKWCDFVSYDPRLEPAGLSLYIQRIERDDKYIAKLELAITSFQADADALIAKLQEAAK